MRVWLINIGEEIPTDPGRPRLLRTGILAERMVARGHDVVWWNASVNHQRRVQRATQTRVQPTAEGYTLVLLYGRNYKRNVSLARVVSHSENAREFRRLSERLERPDVILCGYPSIELARAAIDYADRHKVPIAIDFRDMWPDIIEDELTWAFRVAASPVLKYWHRCHRNIVARATSVVGITEGFVAWALAKGNRKKSALDRSFHLSVNPTRPTISQISEAEQFWDAAGVVRDDRRRICAFAGTFSKRTDLIGVVRGIAALSDVEQRQIVVVLCGRGELESDIREAAHGLPGLKIAGWRSAAELFVLLRRSDVGLLPYLPSRDFLESYPNKAGEYFSAGLPIVSGLGGQLGSLLSKHDIGFRYQTGDISSTAAAFRNVITSGNRLAEMRARALDVYHELFDPVKIYSEFCAHLESLAQPGVYSKVCYERS